MPSPALTTLRSQRIVEVRALLGLRPARGVKERIHTVAADAVNRAVVVVLTAHLEGFVEDLVGDIIDEIHALEPDVDRLPRELLAAQVLPEMRLIAEMHDPAKIVTRVDELFRASAPLWTVGDLAAGALSAVLVTGEMSNPGGKEISRLFGLLGMNDVFANVQLPDQADPEKRTNEIVGIRNSVAHGGSPTVTDDQASEYISSVEALCDGLDIAAVAHISSICGAPASWS
jgi:hypothetical protein